MTNTPTREHREAAAIARAGGTTELLIYERRFIEGEPQRGLGVPGRVAELERIAQAICDAEQRGFDRGLANRDERCLQSDMQRIRERLAFERGREAERAEVVAWLRANGFRNSSFVDDIEAGKHRAKGE